PVASIEHDLVGFVIELHELLADVFVLDGIARLNERLSFRTEDLDELAYAAGAQRFSQCLESLLRCGESRLQRTGCEARPEGGQEKRLCKEDRPAEGEPARGSKGEGRGRSTGAHLRPPPVRGIRVPPPRLTPPRLAAPRFA